MRIWRCAIWAIIFTSIASGVGYAQDIRATLADWKQEWIEQGVVDVNLPTTESLTSEQLLVNLAQLGSAAYITGTDPMGFAFAFQALNQLLDGRQLDSSLLAALDSPDAKTRAQAAYALGVYFERTRKVCAPNNPLPAGCSAVGIFYNGNRTTYIVNQLQQEINQRKNWNTTEFLRLSRSARTVLEDTSLAPEALAVLLTQKLLIESDANVKQGLVNALSSYMASNSSGVKNLTEVLRTGMAKTPESVADAFVLAVAELNVEDVVKAQAWISVFNALESTESLSALGVLVGFPNFNVAWKSAETAAWIAGKGQFSYWIDSLHDQHSVIRWAGTRVFAAIGAGLAPAVSLQVGDAKTHQAAVITGLFALLSDKEETVRWAALEALDLWVGIDATYPTDQLLAIIRETTTPEDARARAARILERIKPEDIAAYPEVASLSQLHNKIALYKSKTEGYNTFRIPAILQTPKGTLLAFAEGRRNSSSDTGDIDVVLKRSADQGQTWSSLQVVWSDGANTSGNPTPVVDEETGRIWLFMAHNHGQDTEAEIGAGTSIGIRTIWSTYSDDDGITWSQPRNMFSEVQDPGTRGDTMGPGIGIQLRHGPHKGRMLLPALGRVIYSDDHGQTWQQGGKGGASNESQVVELSDGRVMRNDRPASWAPSGAVGSRRVLTISNDQGGSWGPVRYAPELTTPYVQGSVIRYIPADSTGFESRSLVFSNPSMETQRYSMSVWLSQDDGVTWPSSRLIHAGPSGYSCLVPLADGSVGLLFEGGKDWAYENIYWTRFSLDWLKGK